MKRLFAVLGLGVALSGALAGTAMAELKAGASAPNFTVPATLGGKEFTFTLANALKKGPVVVYFYPAAFTKGCTIEAHEFAAAMDQYKALHTTVIGVSHDKIAKLDDFSKSECQSKFPVAADPDGKVIGDYDAKLSIAPGLANRTSYVITPDMKVLYAYSNLSPEKHVENTLEAIKGWEAAHKS